jgi:superfamily II DNA or RNA helicase
LKKILPFLLSSYFSTIQNSYLNKLGLAWKLKEIPFSFDTILRGYQQPVIDNISKKDLGVIVAPRVLVKQSWGCAF